jgi:hypothetical protein
MVRPFHFSLTVNGLVHEGNKDYPPHVHAREILDSVFQSAINECNAAKLRHMKFFNEGEGSEFFQSIDAKIKAFQDIQESIKAVND